MGLSGNEVAAVPILRTALLAPIGRPKADTAVTPMVMARTNVFATFMVVVVMLKIIRLTVVVGGVM